jgi:hypothetical protein
MPFYQQYQHGSQQISEVEVIVVVRCKVFTAVLLKIVLDCPEGGGSRLFRNLSTFILIHAALNARTRIFITGIITGY